MTEAKSPREIAAAIAIRWPVISSAQEIDLATEIEAALLSYAAERERLLAEADAVIAFNEDKDRDHHGGVIWRDACRWMYEAVERHRSRLSSLPATEGKREDD